MIHALTDLAVRFPKIAGLIGLVISIVFGALGVSSYMEMQKIADKAQEATLSSIVTYLNSNDRYWVNVKDGSFDCKSVHYEQVGSGTNTEVFLENHDKSIVMLVTYVQELPCEDIKNNVVSGVAYLMSEKHRSLLTADHWVDNYSTQTVFVELCTTCSQGSSMGLIILSMIFVPLGLSFYPLAIWRKRYIEKPDVSNDVDDIFER